jgi:glutamate 5-kinase
VIARGLAEYDAGDAAKVLGQRNEAQGPLLGYAPRSTLVHRSNMALL